MLSNRFDRFVSFRLEQLVNYVLPVQMQFGKDDEKRPEKPIRDMRELARMIVSADPVDDRRGAEYLLNIADANSELQAAMTNAVEKELCGSCPTAVELLNSQNKTICGEKLKAIKAEWDKARNIDIIAEINFLEPLIISGLKKIVADEKSDCRFTARGLAQEIGREADFVENIFDTLYDSSRTYECYADMEGVPISRADIAGILQEAAQSFDREEEAESSET